MNTNEQIQSNVNTNSAPSELKITDLRTATVASIYDYPIIKIETNQGVYGIGEVRDAGHRENVLQFKSMLLGQNPCNIDMIFRAIKQFGNSGRESGGICAIELALWDLIGKVYGVPCYQFFGGKYRDKIRLYADTPQPMDATPEKYAEKVLSRKALGLTYIKFDVGMHILEGYVDGGVVGKASPYDYTLGNRRTARGTALGTQLTDRGIARFEEIVAAVREAVGWETAIAVDHFGPITVKDAIRLGRALEPYGLGWMEDILPWWDVEGNKEVTQAINVPTLNGEDIYLLDGWKEMIEKRAIDIIQPDLLTSGGMLETKRISDYAERFGLPTVLHFAGSPIAFMANLHAAAAMPSFIALEHHGLDMPFWDDLVTGMPGNYMQDGFVAVPEAPGLGVDLNEEVIRANLRPPSGYFESTDGWNTPKLGFWQPDKKWDNVGRE